MDPTTLASKLINTRDNFTEYYDVGSEIGKGRYATVKKCYCKKTQQIYAAKIIKNFRSKNKMNLNIVENEITALTLTRSHPSIVTLYEVFYDRGETILILEYATEKDLHIYLDNEGAFEEEKACHIVYQVLKALEFLHSKNILHLDIKPENVLLMNPLSPVTLKDADKSDTEKNNNTSNTKNNNNNSLLIDEKITIDSSSPSLSAEDSSNIKVKLCDFSFSQILIPGKQVLGMMGTVAYSAPEVLQYEPLTKATDMWSLGVLAHVLLTEYTPFGNGTEKNLQTETNILSVRDKEFKCVEDYFETVSVEAQDFLENLLQYRPKHRLTVEEALNHAWFQKHMPSLKRNIHNTTLNECNDCSHEAIITNKLLDTPSPSSPLSSSSSSSSSTTSQYSQSIIKETSTIKNSKEISSSSSTSSSSSSSQSSSSTQQELKQHHDTIISSLSSSSTSSTSSIENNTTTTSTHQRSLLNSSVKTKLDQVEANLLASDDFLSLEAVTKSIQSVNNKNNFTTSSSSSSSSSTIQHLITSTTNFKLENSSKLISQSENKLGSNHNNNTHNISSEFTNSSAPSTSVLASRLLNIAELATQF